MPSQNERIIAEHAGYGVWDFICYNHPEINGDEQYLPGALKLRQISGPRASIEVMKSHCDNDHPGIRMKLERTNRGKTWRGIYKGRAERQMQRAGQR